MREIYNINDGVYNAGEEPLPFAGLSSQDVAERVEAGQFNRSIHGSSKPIREILTENLLSVFNVVVVLLIAVLCIFYWRTGDIRLILDFIGISLVASTNTVIAIYQEIKAKRALEKVELLLRRSITVARNGKLEEIEPGDIVSGDVILVRRGDQVVVDGTVLSSEMAEIDESLLTGESVPVVKHINDELLSGSFCISGRAWYVATKVGKDSYAASVTAMARKFKLNSSPLQKRIDFIVSTLFGIAVVLVALKITLADSAFWVSVPALRELVTIILALLPQGLVFFTSVTMALSVYRMSQQGAIVQKLNAVESMAGVSVVCMDKTGTLTQNKLVVHKTVYQGQEEHASLLESLVGTFAHISLEKNATIKALADLPRFETQGEVLQVPFNSNNKFSAVQFEAMGRTYKLVLGAADILIPLCDFSAQQSLLTAFKDPGLDAFRNLVLAEVPPQIALADLNKGLVSARLSPLCLLAIADEIRDDAFRAISLFQENNIDVKILSGDAPGSVLHAVQQAGLAWPMESALSGDDIERCSDSELGALSTQGHVFARLKPDHKLRIVRALRKARHHTAMVGDGVNDLPALKEADLSIAMEEGSPISKEVADIILLKNKFSLLPGIMEEGRRVINTVSSVAKLYLTQNVTVIILALLAIFFDLEFALTPRRVSLITVLGIGLPAYFLVMKSIRATPVRYFFSEVLSLAFVAAIILNIGSQVTLGWVSERWNLTREEQQMVVASVLIISGLANFLSVSIRRAEKSNHIFFLIAAALFASFTFVSLTTMNIPPISWIKTFYEVVPLPGDTWISVLVGGLGTSLALVLAELARRSVIRRVLARLERSEK